MSGLLNILGSAGLGAALMYILDPARGRRRRALMRDQAVSAAHEIGDASATTARDLRNRTTGQVARVRGLFDRSPVSDDVLAERVRSTLGFLSSHPGSLDVSATLGRVILSGPVLADEAAGVVAGVRALRGVRAVDDRMTVYRESGAVPGLQGQPRPPRGGGEFPWTQTVWSPTARLMAGVTGGALALWSVRRRGLLGTVAGLGGLGLLLRGATNLELKRLTGIGAGRRAVTVQKTVHVMAPVDRVYAFWRHVENFPRFMSNVREVQALDAERTRWVVAGPGGIPVQWDAELTADVPGRILAWRSAPGSVVDHAGIVRFDADRDGGTRVHVRMAYNPPAGALGHAVAALLGGDPKQVLDEDMVRFKSLLEEGKTSAHGQRVTMGDVAR